MPDPLFIDRDGHRTWLKWHRARRRADDPVFTGARILEAMRLGASCEVDLVVHRGHGFAVLHDMELDRETDGAGPVRQADADALRALHLRGNDGAPITDKVMLLEDLCALLAATPPHPDALLQLDYKEDMAALDGRTLANFANAVGPVASSMIASGGDFAAITALAAAAPGLRTGYDPCSGEPLARLTASGDYGAFISDALAHAPDAAMIYLDYGLVLAADEAGFDLIGAVHAGGRRVDAWTIQRVTPKTLEQARRLVELRVDQITTDDPEGLLAAFDT